LLAGEPQHKRGAVLREGVCSGDDRIEFRLIHIFDRRASSFLMDRAAGNC
jgi:hypothetical protein